MAKVAEITKQFLAIDREAGTALERLVSKIFMVPQQQFGSNKVVLRAKFDLRLAALLPDQVLAALQGVPDGPVAAGGLRDFRRWQQSREPQVLK